MNATLTLFFTFLAAATASAQKSGSCVNPSLQWTINPIYVDGTANAVQSDGATYIDGQLGVSAVVHVCSGTNDAILLLSKGRTFTTSFAKLLAFNSDTPSWALSGSTQSETSSTIHNLFFVPSGKDRTQDEYSFTTRGGAGVAMYNPSPDAPSSVSNLVSISNLPDPDSLVNVHHCPANSNTTTCPNITNETWFVYPDPNPTASGVGQTGLPITQVGALIVSSKGRTVNGGEFSVPFYFTISLLN